MDKTFQLGTSPASLDVGDLRESKNVDVAVANRVGNSVSLMFNNGDGTFAGAFMIEPCPVTLEGNDVRLEPLQGCQVVGFRVDNLNSRSQQASRHSVRPKTASSVISRRVPTGRRDSHMYSILAREWPEVRQHLEQRLRRHGR